MIWSRAQAIAGRSLAAGSRATDCGPARRRPCPGALTCARCAGRGGGHAADRRRGRRRHFDGRRRRGWPAWRRWRRERSRTASGVRARPTAPPVAASPPAESPRPSLERGRRAAPRPARPHRCSQRRRRDREPAPSGRSCVFSSGRAPPSHERTSCWRCSCSPSTHVASGRGGWWKRGKRCASRRWRVSAAAAMRAGRPPSSKRTSRAARSCRPSCEMPDSAP